MAIVVSNDPAQVRNRHAAERPKSSATYSYADEVSDTDLTTIRVSRGVSEKRQRSAPSSATGAGSCLRWMTIVPQQY
jgi:hypothetical protein